MESSGKLGLPRFATIKERSKEIALDMMKLSDINCGCTIVEKLLPPWSLLELVKHAFQAEKDSSRPEATSLS